MKTAAVPTTVGQASAGPVGIPGGSRDAVVHLLLEEGPIAASEIGQRLGMSSAGVRRHLDLMIESGQATTVEPARSTVRGRGRPAKEFVLTAAGRKAHHSYDRLAIDALHALREEGGEAAVARFARRRIDAVVANIVPLPADADADAVRAQADRVADALTSAGFAADTRDVGNGVQICQHHCPVVDAAATFPELCEAEISAYTYALGTHVQRLATIANGDCVCTTHVPLPVALSSPEVRATGTVKPRGPDPGGPERESSRPATNSPITAIDQEGQS